jgi:hypothetical protein
MQRMPITFYALYRYTVERGSSWARLGLGASIWFACCDLCYRTIELWVVTRDWMARWAEASGAERAALVARIELWDELVGGWYVMLLTTHTIGLAAFAAALGSRGGWLDRLAFVSQVAYAVLCGLRLVAYVVPALGPICLAVFLPTVATASVVVGALLLRTYCGARRPETCPASMTRDRICGPAT